MEWMLMPYKRYFDFSGRSRRKEYWMFFLLSMIVTMICVILMFSGGMPSETDPAAQPGGMFWLGTGLMVIWGLASIIPSIAVQVRRFHDQDKSGWFVLLGFIPYLGGIIVLIFMMLEGTRGPNRFGDDPKDPMNAGVFS